jgi:CheY-like chemotaxis protein
MSQSEKFKNKAILLIDDNELDNFVNQRVIQNHRFSEHVYAVTSARSALEFINNLNQLGKGSSSLFPTVIFIDINMPEINGFEFIEYFEQKKSENLLAPKLVILTSSLNSQDKLLALEASENVAFFNKPLTPEKLDEISN